ncbi:MAG: pilus assembly protein N-terminal domain-containing protein [Armatimonadota bacterium]|jgi:Flp pilus assembly secretin CpaC
MQNVHRSMITAALLAVLALGAVAVIPTQVATAQGSSHWTFDNTRPGSSQTLILERNRSVMLKFNGLRRVAVVDPAVADVRVMSQTELLVMASPRPAVQDQNHTMLYVWDRDGLHNFAVTVVGMRLAERIAVELQQSLSPNLNVEVVSDTMVVVEGQVADDAAKENLQALLEAAETDEVKVVGMITTADETTSSAARAADALDQILDPRVKVSSWGDDVVMIEGELPTREDVQRAREAATAVTQGLRLVDMLTLEGEGIGERAPAAEIQRMLGPDFTVIPLHGNAVAVDGMVESAEALERINRLLDAYEDVQTVNLVQVVPPRPDLDAAKRALDAAIGESITVTRMGDEALMLEGSVPTEEALAQLGQVTAMFAGRVPIVNLVTVVEPERRRVLVAVKIIELNRGGAEELGIDWGQYEGTRFDDASYRGQPFLFGQVPGVDGWPELYRFASQIHALVNRQKARILSEPNLLVNEGEEAEILIGGEIPVPIAQAGVGGAASITVEWKPFGVNLQIKPTIGPNNDRIKLEVQPEVSSLDFGSGVTVGGMSIPALRTRRAQTIVSVPDGGVLAIGGLIQSEQSKSVSKIPLLGDLPILGQLFRHDTFRNDKSELIILVLPQILGDDGRPLHPIPLPEGMDPEEVMRFGSAPQGRIEVE